MYYRDTITRCHIHRIRSSVRGTKSPKWRTTRTKSAHTQNWQSVKDAWHHSFIRSSRNPFANAGARWPCPLCYDRSSDWVHRFWPTLNLRRTSLNSFFIRFATHEPNIDSVHIFAGTYARARPNYIHERQKVNAKYKFQFITYLIGEHRVAQSR